MKKKRDNVLISATDKSKILVAIVAIVMKSQTLTKTTKMDMCALRKVVSDSWLDYVNI